MVSAPREPAPFPIRARTEADGKVASWGLLAWEDPFDEAGPASPFRADTPMLEEAPEPAAPAPFDLDGVAALIRYIGEVARNENLPAEPRRRLRGLVQRYNRHRQAGARPNAWLEHSSLNFMSTKS